MFKYEKRLQYPVNITKKDLRMAKYLITQYGGPNGELGAVIRYFNHSFTMPDNRGKALLIDIATEELGHLEIIATMVYQLLKNATLDELKEAGLDGHYAEHKRGIFTMDSSGVPFSTSGIGATGDYKADLVEDMAAEQKARAIYENLIDLTTDQNIIDTLLFLRQREVIHYDRFKELLEYYEKTLK